MKRKGIDMKFEVMQEKLMEGLSLVSRAVASRPQLPVLANILLEVGSEGITLSATDLEIGMRVRVSAKVEKEGVVSVPARMLLDFVGALTPGKISCVLKEESLQLVSGGYRGKIQTIGAEEFPKMPELSAEPMIEVEAKEWSESVSTVAYAAARDALRPVLTGVLLECKESEEEKSKKMKLVATDGFRLSVKKLKVKGRGWEKPLLVPVRAIAEAAKLAGEGELLITHYPKTNQVGFVQGERMLVSQLLSGNYPEYGRIIPDDFESSVIVSREEMLSALKAVHIFARENSNVVRWKVSQQGIELLAETPEKGEAKAEVEGVVEGEGGEIVFNAKFVLDYLGAASEERVRLSMSSALAPGVWTQEKSEEEWLYVVMPINA